MRMIGIVTDSMSCLTDRDCINNNVDIVHATCVVNGKKLRDTLCDFSGPLCASHTIAPTSAGYFKVFSRLSESENCEGIICITSSSKVSLSYENACIAARAIDNHRISVIDSGSGSGAIHLLIRLCRDLEASGVGFGNMVQIITKQRENITTTFSMRDLQSIMRARRLLSLPAQMPRPIMNQRPVCTFEPSGKITLKETAAGSLNELRALISEHKNPRRIAVCYSEADMHLYELVSMLRRNFPNAHIIKRRVSLSVRIVMGHGVMGVFSYGTGEND